jgi:anti-sigma-K factor RskA
VDVKAYIESGILEAYVLDALSPSERAEVEANVSMHPELAAEVAAIESAMQSYAEAHAETPPAYMQERIWAAISGDEAVKENGASRTIPFTPEVRRRQYSWANAAVLAVLLGSLGVNIMLWSQRNKADSELASIRTSVDSLQKANAAMNEKFIAMNKANDMLADTAMQAITMKSMVPGHPMAATVYWNKQKGEAWVAMQKLPMPEKGKQYQMWVIQDGKPVSMGVLPLELADGKLVAKLDMEIKDGQAFAISLEKEGGNPTPTEVYVLGKV